MGSSQSSPAAATSSTTASEKQQAQLDAAALDKLSQTMGRACLHSSSNKSDAPAHATLTQDDLARWSAAYADNKAANVVGTLLSKQDLLANLVSSKAAVADTQVFNLKLSSEVTPVTNQKSSGRCWLFATTNCARLAFAKKYNVDDFQFSQSYLFFWDSLEKGNYFLEQNLSLIEEGVPLDSRIVQFLNQSPENDGGQWDMVVNLIEKYGLVPQALFPESWHSSNSGRLNSLLTSKLREYALELRALYKQTMDALASQTSKTTAERVSIAVSTCRARKTAQMGEIYTILAMTVGVPPARDAKLTYEFYDKNKKFQSLTLTPLEIYASLASNFVAHECISLINDPRNAIDTLYTVERLGNVWGGRPVLYVNTEARVLEETMVKMLKADVPVWFGCDVGKCSNSALGIMDADLFDYEGTFGTALGMTKAQRLQSGESSMTHAMVIVAAHLDADGKPVRYRVENSWSDTAGSKGYFVCTAEWFRQYAYQIVVPRHMAPKKLVRVFEDTDKAVKLPAWDPMGSLA